MVAIPSLIHRAFWDAHSWTWDGGASPTTTAARTASVLVWVRAHAPPKARVLDVGCATGTHALALAADGYEVVGVDAAGGMLRRARAKAAQRPGARVEFVRADLERGLPSSLGSFDLALCLGVLQCTADLTAALAAMRARLRLGGAVLLEVKDAAAPAPLSDGYSLASRVLAPLKAWASARGARPVAAEALDHALTAAGFRKIEDRSGVGWLRVAAVVA